jgi:pyridoxine 5-phosphate synthase
MAVKTVINHRLITTSIAARVQKTAETLLVENAVELKNVSIVLTDDQEIRKLNNTYRDRNEPTNVLSFPFVDAADPTVMALPLQELGDIIISVDRAEYEARQAGQSLNTRLNWLVIHGFLHLLGYDHEKSDQDAALMSNREEQLLKVIETAGRIPMTHLAINVDHVATIRQARGISEPDPVTAAAICELAGAEGIVVHLREDRRHVQDRDVRILRETVQTKLNLEMGAAKTIIDFALDIKPDMVTLVPEKREELTTEGGLNVAGQKKKIGATIARMNKAGIPVSLFIDPDIKQVKASHKIGATFVEIHTGAYADALDSTTMQQEFDLIEAAALAADEHGLRVNAGHGLNYVNTGPVAAIACIEELSIGHAIISRAVFSGLEQAVRDMAAIIDQANRFR